VSSVGSAFGESLPRVEGTPPGPASRSLAARLKLVESRNVTHLAPDWPVFWEEARGANVRDADGNVFLDLTGAFGVSLLGHAHPRVLEAIHAQASRLVHGMGDVHPPRIKLDLLEKLATLAPWSDTRSVLSSTGSEAVETALKTAALASGRGGILAFQGGYHGLTLGSLATTHRSLFRDPFRDRIFAEVSFAPFPDVAAGDRGIDEMETVTRILAERAAAGSPIGTVIVEPVQGRAGVRVPPPGFLAALARAARHQDMVIVADEVFTGMGRCGDVLASHAMGLDPDIVCLGKALGGGLPVSACVARADVMDAWPESTGEAIHTSTFLGHPLSAAAALAVLDVLREEDVPARAAELGSVILADLRETLSDSGVRIRGRGLMIGIDFTPAVEEERLPGIGSRLARAALAEGILVLPAGERGEVVELTPPVCLTLDQERYAVERMDALVRRALP